MILDYKFAMSNGTRDMKLMDLINHAASYSFMSFLVAKYLGSVVRFNSTPVAVELANGITVCSLGFANGLLLSGIQQPYVIFLVIDVLFEVILIM